MTSSSRPASLSPRQKANVSSARKGEVQTAGSPDPAHGRTQIWGQWYYPSELGNSSELSGQWTSPAGDTASKHTCCPQAQLPVWSRPPWDPTPAAPRSPQEDPVPPMVVVQSPESSQVSMVMVAGDPFTATKMEADEPACLASKQPPCCLTQPTSTGTGAAGPLPCTWIVLSTVQSQAPQAHTEQKEPTGPRRPTT